MAIDKKTLLASLASAGGILSMAIPVAGELIPVISGIVLAVKSFVNKQGEVEYTVVLKMGQEELAATIALSQQDIALVNAELAKLGKPPLTT